MASYFIPISTYKKMEARGVTEREVNDVWNNGEWVPFATQKSLKRRYESFGFEVGITFVKMDTGQDMITGVWKRKIGGK